MIVEESKYIVKKKNIKNVINEDVNLNESEDGDSDKSDED